MDQFGDSLRVLHDRLLGQFSFKTTIQIGIQIINVLERLHNHGFVFNDLKPDNIVVGNVSLDDYSEQDLQRINHQLWKLRLIDFGLASKIYDDNGNHIQQELCDKFKGSMLFASQHVFNFYITSRRDDLISLCYILIYLIDDN